MGVFGKIRRKININDVPHLAGHNSNLGTKHKIIQTLESYFVKINRLLTLVQFKLCVI